MIKHVTTGSGKNGAMPTYVFAVEASMIFDESSPFEVKFEFQGPGQDEPTEWTFARDLINFAAEGHVPAKGDIMIAFVKDQCQMQLQSPEGSGMVWLPGADVKKFLAATYVAVPDGNEASQYDWDNVIAQLIGDGAQ